MVVGDLVTGLRLAAAVSVSAPGGYAKGFRKLVLQVPTSVPAEAEPKPIENAGGRWALDHIEQLAFWMARHEPASHASLRPSSTHGTPARSRTTADPG